MAQNNATTVDEPPAETLARLNEGDVVSMQYERDGSITGGGHAEVVDVMSDSEVRVDEGGEGGTIWEARGDKVVEHYDSPANLASVVNIEIVNEANEIEWESDINYDDDDGEYDRSASAKLIIDGPDGRLTVLKRYRAMIDESKGLMEPGKISEDLTYYRPGENTPFTDGGAEWTVPKDVLADREAFLADCRAAVEADPEVEYEQHAQDL